MYIVPIAWIYVTLMMSVAEASNSTGTVLGAIVTFVLYGLLPVALMVYFMGTPARQRARRAQEHAERQAAIEAHRALADQAPTPSPTPPTPASGQPNTGSLPPTHTVPPVAEKQ